jgi:hypothetical protein
MTARDWARLHALIEQRVIDLHAGPPMERVHSPAVHFLHIVETETVTATLLLFVAPFSTLLGFHDQHILQALAWDQMYRYDLGHHSQKYE